MPLNCASIDSNKEKDGGVSELDSCFMSVCEKHCISGNMVFLYLLKLGAKNSLNGVVDADGGTTFKHLFTAFQWKR